MAGSPERAAAFFRRALDGRVGRVWGFIGGLLAVFPVWLWLNGPRFDWERDLARIPGAELAAMMIAAGLVYLLLVPLIGYTLDRGGAEARRAFRIVIVMGLGFRAVMMATTPALEDDFYRYLWEGALVANHISPYVVSPNDAKAAPENSELGALAREAGTVLARVNHPALTSTYPPVAQLVFAAMHKLAPWRFLAWRGLCLLADGIILLLLIALLRRAGRAELWAALYWWNPLVLKELINSVHMEAVLMVVVLAALLLAVTGRYFSSLTVLALAVGMKLWPLLLAPLLLRKAGGLNRRFVLGGALFIVLTGAMLLPFVFAQEATSGLLAYARHWTTNSALFPVIEGAVAQALSAVGLDGLAWAVSRGLVGAILFGLALWLARKPAGSAQDELRHVALLCGALVLLSPAQFPWYMTWMLPIMVFWPVVGLLAATAMTPLYYYSFHLIARGELALYTTWLVWLVWLPVWLLLARHLFRARQGPAIAG